MLGGMTGQILTPEELERAKPKLPDPWVEEGLLGADRRDAIESVAGMDLWIEDLTEGEKRGELRTPRAAYVLGRRWVRVRNTETGTVAFLRLQQRVTPEQPSVRVSSVVLPFNPDKDLTGADLRSVPIQALTAAYSAHEDEGNANLMRSLLLMGELDEDPLAPLPPAESSDVFSARVSRQYIEIERQHPELSPVEEMMRINNAARSSVQRWVTRARKRGLLPPAVQGKRND